MTRSILRYVTLPVGLVTLALAASLALLFYAHGREVDNQNTALAGLIGSSGTDFIEENQPVRACLYLQPNDLHVGDSLGVVLRLRKLQEPTDLCDRPLDPHANLNELGRLSGGVLSPTLLAAADCQVTPANARAAKTNADIRDLVWVWGVDCKTEGKKALQVYLSFQDSRGSVSAATLNFQQLKHFNVSVSPWQTILTWLTAAGSLVSVLSAVAAVFATDKAPTKK